jgi:hypothetical protein
VKEWTGRSGRSKELRERSLKPLQISFEEDHTRRN